MATDGKAEVDLVKNKMSHGVSHAYLSRLRKLTSIGFKLINKKQTMSSDYKSCKSERNNIQKNVCTCSAKTP